MTGTLTNCMACGKPMMCGPCSHPICCGPHSVASAFDPAPLREFFAWLEGFEESFTGTYGTGHPSKEQWGKIKAKLDFVRDPWRELRAAMAASPPDPKAAPFALPDLRETNVPLTTTAPTEGTDHE